MTQYCRYCVNLHVNNGAYCSALGKYKTEKSCKNSNKCKSFELVTCEPEYQDAFMETKGYIPHERKAKNIAGQITLFA